MTRKWQFKYQFPDIIQTEKCYLNYLILTNTYSLGSFKPLNSIQTTFTDAEIRQMEKEYDLSQFMKVLVKE